MAESIDSLEILILYLETLNSTAGGVFPRTLSFSVCESDGKDTSQL